jgi:hypothetical protein
MFGRSSMPGRCATPILNIKRRKNEGYATFAGHKNAGSGQILAEFEDSADL